MKKNWKETLKLWLGALLIPFAVVAEAVSTGCKKLRTLPKKVMAVCIAAALLVAMIPAYVFAADTHTNHCVCGEQESVHSGCKDVEWTEWNGTDAIPYDSNKTAYVYLSADAERASTLTVNSGYTLYLCLNGNTLSPADGFTDRAIRVNSGATFVLTDCGTDGAISGFTSAYGGGGVYNYQGTFTMYGGTISGNRATGTGAAGDGGGVYNFEGTFTMYGGTISGNTASRNGGGVCNSGTVTMENSTVSGNTSVYNGGGVYNYGTFTMENVTVSDNTANTAESPLGAYGGGIYCNDGTLTVRGGTISGNEIKGRSNTSGGGIYVSRSVTVEITDVTISGNTAYSGGGVSNYGTLTMENVTISGNTSTNYGGGVYNYGTFTMENSTVSGNTADYDGGGVYNDGGTFTMENSTVSGNTSACNGGGVYNYGTFTMENVTVSDNTANTGESTYGAYGGGIYCSTGTLTMRGGTIRGNEIKGTRNTGGGGIAVGYGAKAEITDVTISGNTSTNYGGGITVYNGATAEITDVTISGNTAYSGGGVYNYGTFTMKNSTVSENTSTNYGGGVYNCGTLNLSGNTKIIDNTKGTAGNLTPNNIYLASGETVTVAGALTCEDASIGVAMTYRGGTFTTGGAAYIGKFVSDDSAYGIAVDGENLALKYQYTVTFNYGTLGSETKMVSSGETVTPPAPAFAGKVLVGWYTDSSFATEFNFSTAINTNKTIYARFADYEGDKAELQDAIDALETAVGNVETALNNKVSTDKLTEEVGKLNQAIADAKTYADTQDAALKTTLEAADATMNAAIAALTTRVQDLEAGLAAANSKVDTNTSDVTALKSDVATLNTWKNEAQSAIAALQTLTATQSGDIARLKTAVQGLEAALAAAEARIDDAEDRIAALEGKVAALETAKQNLDAAVAALNAAINNKADTVVLNQKVTDLTAAIAAAEDAAKTYADGKDTALQTQLTAAIATAKGEAITAAENLVNTAKAELQTAINNKADIATLNAKVAELNAAIATAEATAKAYTDSAVTTLNAAIITAKDEAVDAAKDLVDAAKAQLQAAIDNKADTAAVNAAIANLQNAITALQNAKDNYIAADAALKAELEEKIAKAKQEAIDAAKGHIPYIGTNGNWWVGDTDTGVDANGIKGDKGDKGDAGADGVGIAKIEKTATNGNVDTYTVTLTNGKTYTFTVTNGKDGADGKDGENGKDGADGKDGLTPFIGENGNWWIGDTDTGVKAVAEQTAQKGTDTITVVSIVVASVALLSNLALVVWIVTKKKKVLV